MTNKIIEFIDIYLENIQETIEKYGIYKTIYYALKFIINSKIFTYEELRKELSLYLKRIISEKEFEQLLSKDEVEYALLFSR